MRPFGRQAVSLPTRLESRRPPTPRAQQRANPGKLSPRRVPLGVWRPYLHVRHPQPEALVMAFSLAQGRAKEILGGHALLDRLLKYSARTQLPQIVEIERVHKRRISARTRSRTVSLVLFSQRTSLSMRLKSSLWRLVRPERCLGDGFSPGCWVSL